MSRKHRNEALVGAFILTSLGLFVALLFLMGSLDALFAKMEPFEADFGDVQGLQRGDPVLLFGMKVGRVVDLRLLPRADGAPATIRVAMVMPSMYRAYLREDSRTRIDKSLTGNISVVIQESGGAALPAGVPLKGTPAADFGAVTEKVNQVLDEGEKLVQTVSAIAKTIEEKGDLSAASSDLAALVKYVRSEVVPLKDNLQQALDLFRNILEENRLDIRHAVASLKETTSLAKDFTDKLNSTPALVESSLAELEKAGASVSDLIAQNRVHIDSILEDLSATSANAANLTAEVKRRPWRLLYKPSEEEEQAMSLYDAAWAYNLGATELNRSVRDLVAHLEQAGRPGRTDDSLVKEAADRVRLSLQKHKEAEEAFWEKLRSSE